MTSAIGPRVVRQVADGHNFSPYLAYCSWSCKSDLPVIHILPLSAIC